jgi:hypothetical protein
MLSKAIEPFAKFNPREVSCTTFLIFLAVGESHEGLLANRHSQEAQHPQLKCL